MDLLRSTIKCLLYDWPIEPVAETVFSESEKEGKKTKKAGGNPEAEFCDRLSELLKWRERRFTATEAENLAKVVIYEWMDVKNNKTDCLYDLILFGVAYCSEQILNIGVGEPEVPFRNLLRWRDLTILTDEDLLITAGLARFDEQNNHTGKKRIALHWTRPLGHDNRELNALLKENLSDTHAHLNASADIFEVNWAAAMNFPRTLSINENNVYRGVFKGKRQEYDPVNRFSNINLSLAEWGAVAAAIRLGIYYVICGESSEKLQILAMRVPGHREEVMSLINNIVPQINEVRSHGMKTSDDVVYDYAFSEDMAGKLYEENLLTRPETLLYGERHLLYQFQRLLFEGNEIARQLAGVFYLYVLIKNKIRREFVQTNSLHGFANFKAYQDSKLLFISNTPHEVRECYEKSGLRFAVQTSLRGGQMRRFEARTGASAIESVRKAHLELPIFCRKDEISEFKEDVLNRLTLVAYFFKSKPQYKAHGAGRFDFCRRKFNEDFEKVIKAIRDNAHNKIKFTGIDACGSEIDCPPEVFAGLYDRARMNGIRNFTFHVGEDFHDLLHGLRSIDEAIKFLKFSSGSRLGHALALGIDPNSYYSNRKHCVVIPRQTLLDNVVWLKFRSRDFNLCLQSNTELFIESQFHDLIEKIGYSQCDILDYWKSMKLRSHEYIKIAENAPKPVKILHEYLYDDDIFEKGTSAIGLKLPAYIHLDVEKLQMNLMKEITKAGITIEANPTSNLMIGSFERYDELPLFRFHSVEKDGEAMMVSINTDDKGIFATSLENEYSLLALAMLKAKNSDGNNKWNGQQVDEYLRRLAHYGNISLFANEGSSSLYLT